MARRPRQVGRSGARGVVGQRAFSLHLRFARSERLSIGREVLDAAAARRQPADAATQGSLDRATGGVAGWQRGLHSGLRRSRFPADDPSGRLVSGETPVDVAGPHYRRTVRAHAGRDPTSRRGRRLRLARASRSRSRKKTLVSESAASSITSDWCGSIRQRTRSVGNTSPAAKRLPTGQPQLALTIGSCSPTRAAVSPLSIHALARARERASH